MSVNRLGGSDSGRRIEIKTEDAARMIKLDHGMTNVRGATPTTYGDTNAALRW